MASEAENSPEVTLESVEVALKAIKSDDLDINPFTVARQLEVSPHHIFQSRELMARVLEARRKTQGDSATFTYDSEMAGRVVEMEGEIAKLLEVNQELYDRALALEEQSLAFEAKIVDLEQEAETLAMQLQNSWHLGYQKGVSDEKNKAQEAKPAPKAEETEKSAPHITADHEPVVKAPEAEIETPVEKPIEKQAEKKVEKEAEEKSEEISPEKLKGPALTAVTGKAKASEEGPKENITTGDFEAQAAGYNDKIFNAVSDSFFATSSRENYSAFSWRDIETVYQYSTVAGRPGINLYFEPFHQSPLPEPEHFERREKVSEPVVTEVLPEPEAETPSKQADTGANIPRFTATSQAEVKEEQKVSQGETQPIPGAVAFLQAQAQAQEAARRQERGEPNERSARAETAPMPVFEPKGISISASGSFSTSAKHAHEDEDLPEGMAERFYTPLTEGLTQSYVDLQAVPDSLVNRSEVSTYDSMDALRFDEKKDELDLEKLDIFEGLEDIEELKNIEVIEDVVLPPESGAETQPGSEAETGESEVVKQTASPEDLRELVKNRIKQAQEHQEAPPEVQKQSHDNIKIDDLKAGARNKFVGGKAGAPEAAAAPAPPPPAAPRVVPPEIRKACMILGVRPEELTVRIVMEAWKREIASPGVHPDLGGDTETAIYLNTAKDELIRWVDAQSPKLGKKFGAPQPKTGETKQPFTMRGPDKSKEKDKK